MILSRSAHAMNGKFKPKLKSDDTPNTSSRYRRSLQGRSLARVLAAILVTVVLISSLKSHFRHSAEEQNTHGEEIVLSSCAGIEALRHVDECFENLDLNKGKKRKPERKVQKQGKHFEHEEDIPWISSYGLVLDYDAAYDRLGETPQDEHYTTKRTLKCLTGFHMSIVWDIEFTTSLLSAYEEGTFGIHPNTTGKVAKSCPAPNSETSASMSIKINCGFDIQRDAWGHPREESDHAELETCVRMAWAWVKGRTGDHQVGPWHNLCREDEFGEIRCDRGVFHLEGAD